MKLEPREGFDWSKVAWGAPEEPRGDSCCYCRELVDEEDVPLLIVAEDGATAVFCKACEVRWWGFGR